MRIAIIASVFIWCGLLLGISFMEAPLKFQAPNITLALGLGIGKLVFGMLNKMECVLALFISASIFYLKDFKPTGLFFGLIVLILLFQSLYLLPFLDARIDIIVAGNEPPASAMHFVYVVLELVKLMALLAFGIWYTKKQVTKPVE